MTQNGNENNTDDKHTIDDAYVASQLKSAQTLITISIIGGPVSLLIGGVLLSTATLICAIVAIVKIRRIKDVQSSYSAIAKNLYSQSIVSIVINSFAFILNAVSFAFAMVAVMDAVSSGNFDSLLQSMYGSSSENLGLFGGGESHDTLNGSIWDR